MKEIEKHFPRQEFRRAAHDEVGRSPLRRAPPGSYVHDLLGTLDLEAIRRAASGSSSTTPIRRPRSSCRSSSGRSASRRSRLAPYAREQRGVGGRWRSRSARPSASSRRPAPISASSSTRAASGSTSSTSRPARCRSSRSSSSSCSCSPRNGKNGTLAFPSRSRASSSRSSRTAASRCGERRPRSRR